MDFDFFLRDLKWRAIALCFILQLATLSSYGQTGCACPATGTCGPCTGGLTSLTIKYTGLGVTLTISDGGGNLFTGSVLTGATVTVHSSAGAGQLFVGSLVTVTGTLLFSETLATNCTDPVTPGTVYQYFQVVSSTDKISGAVCCAPTDDDHVAPTFSTPCPGNVQVFTSSGSCSATATWTPPVATDNCGTVTLTSNHNAGDTFPLGATTVTYTAKDQHNNTSTCSFTVTVKDNIAPTISSCPSNANVFVNASCKFTLPAYTATVADNCGASITQSPAAGTVLSGHNTTQLVTLTATDGAGNASSCSFTITLKDNLAPVISGCPSNISVSAGGSTCGAVVNWTAPTASDNCSMGSFTSNHNSGETFPVGTTTVTYNAVDGASNSATCSFTVKVIENVAPVITNCPSSANVFVDTSCKYTIPTYTATVTDNCGLATLTQSPAAGTVLSGHNTTQLVKLTATDAAGNASSCSFTITLKDNNAPVISGCPSNISVSAGASSCSAIVTWTAPTASDNCSMGSLTSNHNSGETFPVGTTTVTYNAVDAAGNSATCSFTVKVIENVPPVITNCPSSANVFVNASCKFIVPTYTATVTDNCGATLTQSPAAGTVLSGHNTKQLVTLTATDAAGNASSCSFTITLKDNIAPTISSCPANANVPLDASCKFTVPTYAVTVTDNCGATITQSPAAGTVLTGHNTTQLVTLTATDAAGNASSCSFTITLKDNLAPVISGCPVDISLNARPSCDAIATWSSPTVSDNCSSAPSLLSSHASGSTFSFGTTVVTYTATDQVGNTSTCSFKVTVSDNSQLVFSNCPTDINLEADETGEITATWIAPTASTTCGNVTLASSHPPGSLFQVGTTEVKYVATRNDGVTASCTFNVIVTYRNINLEVDQLITPNGDGINDKLRVKNLELFKNNDVIIVDRWGSVIYSATGYNNESVAWDGSNKNGAKVPTGTYFYAISIIFNGQRIKKEGFIELMR